MTEEQGGIREKATEIAMNSVIKTGEIVEGAKQAITGDVQGGITNIVKAAGDIATGAAEKGLGIAADVFDKVKKATE